jgi:hypothetical protein
MNNLDFWRTTGVERSVSGLKQAGFRRKGVNRLLRRHGTVLLKMGRRR